MVLGNQSFLDIRSRAHFLRAAEENPNVARPYVPEKGAFRVVRVIILYEAHLLGWHSHRHKFVTQIFIDGKSLALGWRREIAKDQLGATLIRGFPPDAFDLDGGFVDLAFRKIREI